MPPAPRGAARPLLVVGYDGSGASRQAVAYAARRVGPAGRVVVVHAYGSEGREHGRAVLDALMLEGGDTLVDTDYALELVPGSASSAVVELAHESGADEIILGSRGLGRARAVLGSVSHDVLRHAHCPVVVIPLIAEREPPGSAP